MKLRYIAAVVAASAGLVVAQAQAESSQLTTQKDKVSYTLGVDMGDSFKAQGIEVNPDLVAQGIKDATSGAKLQMTEQQMKDTLVSFQKQLIAKQETKFKAVGEKNLAASNAFFAKNKDAKGIKTTASGLQYKVIEAGTGAKPAADDTVTVDYVGKTIEGTVFDSSYKRGKPATFKVSQVIPGWSQALQMMKTGATWEVYIPPKLAYGARGMGGPIGPNQALMFKIHLISIKKS